MKILRIPRKYFNGWQPVVKTTNWPLTLWSNVLTIQLKSLLNSQRLRGSLKRMPRNRERNLRLQSPVKNLLRLSNILKTNLNVRDSVRSRCFTSPSQLPKGHPREHAWCQYLTIFPRHFRIWVLSLFWLDSYSLPWSSCLSPCAATIRRWKQQKRTRMSRLKRRIDQSNTRRAMTMKEARQTAWLDFLKLSEAEQSTPTNH